MLPEDVAWQMFVWMDFLSIPQMSGIEADIVGAANAADAPGTSLPSYYADKDQLTGLQQETAANLKDAVEVHGV